MAMTLLLSGLVAEALPVIERSGKYFRHLPAFTASILPILKDPNIASLRERWFAPLRNQAVFHNDAAVSESGLGLMKPAVPQDLARGSSESFLDTYYPTADVVAIMFIINAANETESPASFFSESIRAVVDVSARVCLAIDSVVGEALNEWGFVWEEIPPPAG